MIVLKIVIFDMRHILNYAFYLTTVYKIKIIE